MQWETLTGTTSHWSTDQHTPRQRPRRQEANGIDGVRCLKRCDRSGPPSLNLNGGIVVARALG